MKRFYTIACACIVSGLVLMGVGSAVAVCEIKSFSYMGEKYTQSEERNLNEQEVILPNNLSKIFYHERGDFKIEIDDSLEKNKAIFAVSYSNDISSFEINGFNIYDNYYLYNQYTENYSKYPVIYMEIGGYGYSDGRNSLVEFKQVLNDIKNRQIYNYYSDPEIEFILKVSSEDYERFKVISDGYSIKNYGEYMSETEEKRKIEEGREYSDNENTYEEEFPDEITDGYNNFEDTY